MTPLFILSFVLLLTGSLSVLVLSKIKIDYLGLVFRNFVIMAFWPYMIANTVKDIDHLKKVAYFYAVVRIFEVGIIGLIIYFFYYKEFYAYVTISNLDISISDYNNPRLLSIGAPNSNDAAFVLLGALGLIVYKIFISFRIRDFILSTIAFLGMLFTWSRSVWIFLILYFVIILGLNKKIKKSTILIIGSTLFFLTIFSVKLFQDRKSSDDRLQSNENAYSRQQQFINYLTAIPSIPLFWGMYDDPKTITTKLHIKDDLSSENYTLETFTRNGIIAGFIFVLFFLYFLISFGRTTVLFIKLHKNNRDDVIFVIAVFAIYVSLFLMAQSSLFRNNLIIWIMIGFMSVIKQQIYQNHYEK